MIQGRLEVSTRPLRTGPAMPKQATSGRVGRVFQECGDDVAEFAVLTAGKYTLGD